MELVLIMCCPTYTNTADAFFIDVIGKTHGATVRIFFLIP